MPVVLGTYGVPGTVPELESKLSLHPHGQERRAEV